MIRVLGVDPGSRATGYGLVDVDRNRFVHVAHGVVSTKADAPLAARLATIFRALGEVIDEFSPVEAGVENIFNAHNAQSALKLGHARGAILVCAELKGLPIAEYTPMQVKSSVVGYGHATKEQVQDMVKRLLALTQTLKADAADALAVAICHGRTRSTLEVVARSAGGEALSRADLLRRMRR